MKEKKLQWYLLTFNSFKYPRWRKCRKFAYLIWHRHGESIDESHLLNCEEQHNNNKGHVTSDQETAHISEKPQITTTNLKPELLSSTLSLKVHATIIQLQRPLWIKFYNLLLLQDTFTMFHRLKMESTLIFNCRRSTRLSELSAFLRQNESISVSTVKAMFQWK